MLLAATDLRTEYEVLGMVKGSSTKAKHLERTLSLSSQDNRWRCKGILGAARRGESRSGGEDGCCGKGDRSQRDHRHSLFNKQHQQWNRGDRRLRDCSADLAIYGSILRSERMFAMNHINSGFVRGRRDASRKATALAVAAIALLTVCLLQLPAVSGTGPAVAFAADVPGSTSDAAASIGSATALAASADLADGQDTPLVLVWRDELVFRVLGSDFGRVELELHRSADGLAKFIDQTYYDAQATEIVTEWIFGQDAAAPALKLYSFSVETPAGNPMRESPC